MIYNKEPIQVLWDMVKDLKKGRSPIPIYKEIMHEEKNNVPSSYILLRSQVTDTNEVFGDGKGKIRAADCDIVLVTKGYGDDSTDLHNVNKRKIREHLKNQEIDFTEINVGYNESIQSTEHNFTLEILSFG